MSGMPALSFFIDDEDLALLLARLNADPEIAFIVPEVLPGTESAVIRRASTWSRLPLINPFRDGIRNELKTQQAKDTQWKAVRTVDALRDGLNSLWHVPAGSLPLIKVDLGPQPLVVQFPSIPDPWAGWSGPPSFGPGCHAWIRLELWTRHRPYTERERASLYEKNFFWLKDHDMLVVSDLQWTGGHFRPAPLQTQRWWNRMKGWLERTAVRLHRNPSFLAFPSALQKLKNGMQVGRMSSSINSIPSLRLIGLAELRRRNCTKYCIGVHSFPPPS